MERISYRAADIEKKLQPLFDLRLKGQKVKPSAGEIELSKVLFSRNILFLRAYIGLLAEGASYDQASFSELLGISIPGLRRWEAGDVMPNELSLRAITRLANHYLNTPIPIEIPHIIYRNLITEIRLLRMGSHQPEFQNLSREIQLKFASFMSDNTDQLLDYFMQEAQESKINYQMVLDNALVGIYVYNHKNKIIYINQTLTSMSGYTLKDLEKTEFSTLIHPEDRADFQKRIKERMAGKKKHDRFIHRIRNKDGSYNYYEVFSSHIMLSGEPAILGVVQDVGERLEQERLLRDSKEKFESLFHNMVAAFALHEVILDKKGKPVNYRFLEVNPAFEKMTGLKAKSLIGKTVLDVLPNTERIWIEKFGQIALNGRPDHLTEYSRELDRYFDVHGYSPGKGLFAVTFFDVTHLKK